MYDNAQECYKAFCTYTQKHTTPGCGNSRARAASTSILKIAISSIATPGDGARVSRREVFPNARERSHVRVEALRLNQSDEASRGNKRCRLENLIEVFRENVMCRRLELVNVSPSCIAIHYTRLERGGIHERGNEVAQYER